MFDPDQANIILDACEDEKKWFLRLLKKFVTHETPPQKPKDHLKFFHLVRDELQKIGYVATIYPGRKSGGQLLARKPEKCPDGYQLMLGHIDTVWPKGTLKEMPFEKESNKVMGPGIYDMKSGIVMMLTALKVIRALDMEPSLQPVIFLNSDEESGSGDSKDRILRIARSMKRVFVLEPSLDEDGKLKTRRKGVGHFDIKIKGVSSHAGIEPEKGKSAILELSHVIQKLFEMNDPDHGVTVNVGTIEGGISTNVVAADSAASVDVRVLTKTDARRIEEKIKNLKTFTKGTSLVIEGGFGRPPLVHNPRNRTLWKAASELAGTLGINLKEGISGGGSDGSFTSLHTATLDGLGAVGEGAHSPIEKIYLEQTLQRAALLTMLVLAPDLSEDDSPLVELAESTEKNTS